MARSARAGPASRSSASDNRGGHRVGDDLVEKEKWVTREHFNRVLAVYQVLPGPEAHELCVCFGMLSRGRVGGLLAGAGLAGFLLQVR